MTTTLEVGQTYRRVTPLRHIDPGTMLEWPEVECTRVVEGGGWFRELDRSEDGRLIGIVHRYRVEDVEPVSGGRTTAEAEEARCLLCGRDKYSRELCSRHYSRARKLVQEGASWAEAIERQTEEESAWEN